ncbi:hypothetical protein M8818_001855 [Zalaria obscura]|uniref:Uncharacterized protein n=1 Tax=Zalaria obscura TaxID=2024903 RepID=A0ACC3SLI5_9PEZI
MNRKFDDRTSFFLRVGGMVFSTLVVVYVVCSHSASAVCSISPGLSNLSPTAFLAEQKPAETSIVGSEATFARPTIVEDSEPGVEDPSTWQFSPERDSHNYGLSTSQCAVAFPRLYHEIHRAAAYQGQRGNTATVSPPPGPGQVHVAIRNRQLYILSTRYDGNGYDIRRSLAILGSIYRAITASSDPIPDTDFTFSVRDIAEPDHSNRTLWVLARTAATEQHWVMPDFGYWSWELDLVGEYSAVRERMLGNEVDFASKDARALWRGAKNNAVRAALLKAARGRDWADVEEITWRDRTRFMAASQRLAVPMWEHCRYKYLIHTEGRSYSGRGKYLLNCHSVVIMHELEWVENYHHLLVASGPDQNVVSVERDFSDLEDKVRYLNTHPERARRIVDNSVAIFRDRYLTPAAQACYYREMVRSWAKLSDTREVDVGRAVPFETYM